MNWKLLLAGSFKLMSRYKLRTFFMGFAVVVGVATLIAGRALSTGSEQQIMQRVNQMFGPGTILIFSSTLNNADLEAIDQQLEQVISWSPRFTLGELDISYQGADRQAAVYGHSERADFVWNRDVIDGRFFTNDDLVRSARIALIGTRLAETLFGSTSPIGEEILIDAIPFSIVGILEPVGIDPHGEDRDEDIYVPITTAMRRLSNTDYVGSAKIVVSNHQMVDQDAEQIAEIMRERHLIVAGEADDFAIYTSKFAGRSVARANQVLDVYLMVAAGVVLLLAAVVISSIMLVIMRERIAEIGLRKAIGATQLQISQQFLIEVASVTLAAGVAGIGLGIAVASLISKNIDVPMVISAQSIILGLASAVVVGVVSGIAPARKAAALDPVEALR